MEVAMSRTIFRQSVRTVAALAVLITAGSVALAGDRPQLYGQILQQQTYQPKPETPKGLATKKGGASLKRLQSTSLLGIQATPHILGAVP
jgi:hypothetical protein